MRTLALFLILLLAGCAGMSGMTQPLHAPVAVTNEDSAVKAYRVAHEAIDEANAALNALNITIGNNAASGVWTKEQAQDYLDQSKAQGKKLDVAREALRFGNLADANTQAELVKTLLLNLQRKVAAEARKAPK